MTNGQQAGSVAPEGRSWGSNRGPLGNSEEVATRPENEKRKGTSVVIIQTFKAAQGPTASVECNKALGSSVEQVLLLEHEDDD